MPLNFHNTDTIAIISLPIKKKKKKKKTGVIYGYI